MRENDTLCEKSEMLTGVNEARRSGCLKAMAVWHGPRCNMGWGNKLRHVLDLATAMELRLEAASGLRGLRKVQKMCEQNLEQQYALYSVGLPSRTPLSYHYYLRVRTQEVEVGVCTCVKS